MFLYKIPGVEQEPDCELNHWKVARCKYKDGTVEDRLIGEDKYGPRISSAIKHLENGKASTRSGRKYKLGKSNDFSRDSEEMWQVASFSFESIEDVTNEYVT